MKKESNDRRIGTVEKSVFNIKVKPNAHRSEITCEKDGILLISVKSPPEDGKANKELLKVLHKKFGGQFCIVRGAKSREKVVRCMQ